MDKKFLLIGAGAIFLLMGIILLIFMPAKKQALPEKALSEKEAIDIVNSKIREALNFYENSVITYDAKEELIEEVSYLKIKDYDKIVATIFNKDGRKQLEETKINEKNFYLKEGNENYILNNIPEEYSLLQSKASIDSVDIKLNSLIAEVTFSYSLFDKEDNLTYYVITKVVELVKEKDEWLIKDFDYSYF